MFSRHNLHPMDNCICGECGSRGFCHEVGNINFIFAFPFINLHWSQRLFLWRCLPIYEFWHEGLWPTFTFGFGCVPCGRHAFKYESSSRSELWNHNRLFESNVCYTAFIKQIEVLRLQQDQSQICFHFAITFNNDIIFELPPIRFPISHSKQMQGMDCKYDGHVWCKVKTSNIKNNFGLGFKNTRCLGDLHCDNDSYGHFLHFNVWNEVCWTGDFAQIPLTSQFAPGPPICTY